MSAPNSYNGRSRWWPAPRHSQPELKLRCKTLSAARAETERLMTVIERDEAEAVRLLMMYEVKRALELLDDEPLDAAERDCG